MTNELINKKRKKKKLRFKNTFSKNSTSKRKKCYL